MNKEEVDVLRDQHKGSLWITRKGKVWAWVHGDWRMLRNSGLWSGMGLYSGEGQMKIAGPFMKVDFVALEDA